MGLELGMPPATDELAAAECTLQGTETPDGEPSYLVEDPYGLRFHLFER